MARNVKIMDSKVQYWVEMSDYDVETADAVQQTSRYLYVAFMCHQCIEKILKAYWTAVKPEPPLKIHSLSRLAEECGLEAQMNEGQLDFLDRLEPMNIEARYPSYKERLFKSLTKEYCQQLIANTKELQSWIKSKL